MDMNRRFYWEITTFFGKYAFNIHFSVLNVHFCLPNVYFFFIQKSTYMKISIMKLIFLVQTQTSEKYFQIFRCFVNTFLQVRIVCTNKCISEIPRIFRKNIISRRETKCPQIFDEEHCCCSRIAFPDDMDLPQPWNEYRKMMDNLIIKATTLLFIE